MSVITFLSDFGTDSYHTAAFKGALYQEGVSLPLIEISNSLEAFDIVETAYLSAMVYRDFPNNSIHVLATNVVATSFEGHLAARLDDHLFIAPDNGILPLILPEGFSDYHLIPSQGYEQRIQDLYPAFIKRLIQADFDLDKMSNKADKIHTKSKLVPVKDNKELRGTILFVDHFGNAYSNITRAEFERFVLDKPFEIDLSRHASISKISNDFSDVQDGETIAYFSDHDHLVVAIKKGNAEQLLNLRKYKSIIIGLE